jgi:hypothetical protein
MRKLEKKNMNILATWLIGDVAKIHVASYLLKVFRYVVDYSRGEIAT